jgi:hypothetical protein
MSRNLLHKSKLDAFKSWLVLNGFEHRPGRGDYDVLQVKSPITGDWQCVFDRHNAPEHYTVAEPLELVVRRFIREKGKQP